ncbi:hypothetical protein BGY98DRAFT_937285 [Russula aff. rugulosa BPL654]|nr:hypothetical protein BGY98DRAFT_937285 [Russula aff. rugulosa BPL654]
MGTTLGTQGCGAEQYNRKYVETEGMSFKQSYGAGRIVYLSRGVQVFRPIPSSAQRLHQLVRAFAGEPLARHPPKRSKLRTSEGEAGRLRGGSVRDHNERSMFELRTPREQPEARARIGWFDAEAEPNNGTLHEARKWYCEEVRLPT